MVAFLLVFTVLRTAVNSDFVQALVWPLVTSFMWSLRLRDRHHFSTRSSVLPFICDCYEQHRGDPHGSVSCAPTSSELRHYGVFDGTHCSADVCCGLFSGDGGHDACLGVVDLARTWDQKLSSGLMLVTFIIFC